MTFTAEEALLRSVVSAVGNSRDVRLTCPARRVNEITEKVINAMHSWQMSAPVRHWGTRSTPVRDDGTDYDRRQMLPYGTVRIVAGEGKELSMEIV